LRKSELVSLLDTHGKALYTLLVRLTLCADAADDLLQDLFVKLAQSDALSGAHEPYAYVRRVAINLAFDWRRQRHKHAHDGVLSVADPADLQPPPWLAMARAEEAEKILALAADLPALTREAFVLRYVQSASYDEVGRSIGKTSHQARGLCHAAVLEIRQRMGGRVEQQLLLLRDR